MGVLGHTPTSGALLWERLHTFAISGVPSDSAKSAQAYVKDIFRKNKMVLLASSLGEVLYPIATLVKFEDIAPVHAAYVSKNQLDGLIMEQCDEFEIELTYRANSEWYFGYINLIRETLPCGCYLFGVLGNARQYGYAGSQFRLRHLYGNLAADKIDYMFILYAGDIVATYTTEEEVMKVAPKNGFCAYA